jgi:hypothetical protein
MNRKKVAIVHEAQKTDRRMHSEKQRG